MINQTVAFVYKWTHVPSKMWYVGSRTKTSCHPYDGYICSSKIVKPMIEKNPTDWVREIIATGNPAEMVLLEHSILASADAKNNADSFNMHNGNGKFTNAGVQHLDKTKQKISIACKGKPKTFSPKGTEARVTALRQAIKGKSQSPEHKKKRSEAMSGKQQSEEHKAKRAAALRLYHAQKKINNTDTGVFR